ncbi:hypothetical protein ACPCBF_25105 [Streptomyces pseudogriseolus]|uniref:hypothetical protein n=1 Tax=Streptomyces pseudogriseolus TaxID=36817 RepID=UPI003FA20F3F
MSNPAVAQIVDAAHYVKSADLDTTIQLPVPGVFLRDVATLQPGTDYPDDELHRSLAHEINTAPRRKGKGSNGGEWAQLVLTYEQAGVLHDLAMVRRSWLADADVRDHPHAPTTARAYQVVINRLTKRGIISAHRSQRIAERVPYATRWTEVLDDAGTVLARIYETEGPDTLHAFMQRTGASSFRHLRYADLTPAERAHIHRLKHLF